MTGYRHRTGCSVSLSAISRFSRSRKEASEERPRSRNAHVERKKSKCDYLLAECPTDDQVKVIEAKVNEVIAAALPVSIEYMSREEAASIVDLSKLPEDASETLRIVRIGDYDDCACIGAHVGNTSEIGEFRIISHDFNDGIWRVRWKVNAK